MTRMFGAKLGPKTNHWPDAEPLTGLDHRVELLRLLQNNHRVHIHSPGYYGESNVLFVLEPIANKQCLPARPREAAHGKEELGFRSGLEAEVERQPKLHDVLHDIPILVALDWIDALVAGTIAVGPDSKVKGGMQGLQTVLQDVGKADEQREAEAEPASGLGVGCLLHHLHQVYLLVGDGGGTVGAYGDVAGGVGHRNKARPIRQYGRVYLLVGDGGGTVGAYGDVAGGVDTEIRRAPSVNTVECGGKVGGPGGGVLCSAPVATALRRRSTAGVRSRRWKSAVPREAVARVWRCGFYARQGRHLSPVAATNKGETLLPQISMSGWGLCKPPRPEPRPPPQTKQERSGTENKKPSAPSDDPGIPTPALQKTAEEKRPIKDRRARRRRSKAKIHSNTHRRSIRKHGSREAKRRPKR
ncbi:hypothetical protein C4D60_Mb01t13390 [Musa balbisiana]|uniref:Uncharacterized protein n=1 Tax=Musa balbisiana TaxID=52838 RepID=A0A4V4H7B8_MUSBA|nr:hypothetical protein C4D60_Mb01t13390 [Musa balbisiana]